MEFPSEQRVRAAQQPVLVIHSRGDELIPFAHGEALHQAAGERGTLAPIRGGHNGGFLESGSLYTDPVDAFLRANL